MAKKTPSKKLRKPREDTRFPNYVQACEPLLVKHLFRPACTEILTGDGARSLSDLHVRLQNHLKMSMSLAAFARVMDLMPDIKALFTRQHVVRLQGTPAEPEEGPQIPVLRPTAQTAQPPRDGDDGLREGLAPPPGGFDLPTDIPPRQDWNLSALGLAGGSAPVGT